jgi:hypothetical protein
VGTAGETDIGKLEARVLLAEIILERGGFDEAEEILFDVMTESELKLGEDDSLTIRVKMLWACAVAALDHLPEDRPSDLPPPIKVMEDVVQRLLRTFE